MEKLDGIQLPSVFITPSIKPPSATKTLFLIGAGEKHIEIHGNRIKATESGFYMEEEGIKLLAIKWKGKTAAELMDSDEFYDDIYNGPFEKLIHANVLIPLTGRNFSEATSQALVEMWKEDGAYTDLDAAAVNKYVDVFKNETNIAGTSIGLLFLRDGLVTFYIGKDGVIPDTPIGMLDHKKWGPTQMKNALGREGVYPGGRRTVASRLSDLFNQVEWFAKG